MKHEGSLRQTKDELVIGGAYDLTRETDGAGGQPQPWHCLLTDAAPRDHIVQLYQDQDFSIAPSVASRLPRSRTAKLSSWCRRWPTGMPFALAWRPKAWM